MNDFETFYVYRYIGLHEKWDASLAERFTQELPNISFGMKIFAQNEREAIAKGKLAYDKIQSGYSHRVNVKEFMRSIASSVYTKETLDHTNESILDVSIKLVRDYEQYCEKIKEDSINIKSVEKETLAT